MPEEESRAPGELVGLAAIGARPPISESLPEPEDERIAAGTDRPAAQEDLLGAREAAVDHQREARPVRALRKEDVEPLGPAAAVSRPGHAVVGDSPDLVGIEGDLPHLDGAVTGHLAGERAGRAHRVIERRRDPSQNLGRRGVLLRERLAGGQRHQDHEDNQRTACLEPHRRSPLRCALAFRVC